MINLKVMMFQIAVNSLKMKKLDGVDIHLGLQDDMNFLFNPKISDQERAKILSLGKESSYIHKMMEQLKSKTREIKASIKMEEKTLQCFVRKHC